jgi:hypothetical protein
MRSDREIKKDVEAELESAAWLAPAVTKVVNRFTIKP